MFRNFHTLITEVTVDAPKAPAFLTEHTPSAGVINIDRNQESHFLGDELQRMFHELLHTAGLVLTNNTDDHDDEEIYNEETYNEEMPNNRTESEHPRQSDIIVQSLLANSTQQFFRLDRLEDMSGTSDEEQRSSHDTDSDNESSYEASSDDESFVFTSSGSNLRGLLPEDLLGEDLEREAAENGEFHSDQSSASPILLSIKINASQTKT